MARYDFRAPRLFVDAALATDARVPLDAAQINYLVNVLRLRQGEEVLVFNGRDGEWRGVLATAGRMSLVVGAPTRSQTSASDLHYLFAPLKHARLDYMVQKAVEMGVSRLQPVLMRHGQIERVNLARMRANAVEAAEQCGVLNLPEIVEPIALTRLIAQWSATRLMVFCDEDADIADPIAALGAARDGLRTPSLAVLVGPEGGFAPDERAALLALARVVRLSLGPRILRADTAAVAALALVQTVVGDWR